MSGERNPFADPDDTAAPEEFTADPDCPFLSLTRAHNDTTECYACGRRRGEHAAYARQR